MLREQIARGTLVAGAMLPSEDVLCEQYGVSKITIRRAIADLRAQGLLTSRQGRGTSVASSLPEQAAPQGLLESLSRTAQETEAVILGVGLGTPPPTIARQLGLTPEQPAIYADRLRLRIGTPVMVTKSWVPEEIGKGITAEELSKRALFDLLMARGVRFGRVVQEITAVIASPRYADHLVTEVGSPLVRLSRLLFDQNGTPVQHLTVHLRPDRSRIMMDIRPDAMNTLSAGTVVHDE